jgi:hypothetical protein
VNLEVLYILAGAALTVVSSLALGRLAIDRLAIPLERNERLLLSFPVGAALLHAIVFLLAAVGQARRGVFVGLGAAIVAAAWRFQRTAAPGSPSAPLPRAWRAALLALGAAFGVVYLFNALAPEHSPDGVAYHLGLVSRYARHHGFQRITTNMYANLSQGVEMLYLMSFSLGRHSAASLTHLAFLVWLPLAMLAWARREGFPAAGAVAALLVFLSPVVGRDGTTAYNDVAVAAIVFAVFRIVELWRAQQDDRLLILAGLLAGYGYAAKYTAFLCLPYALASVAWRLRGQWRRLARAAIVLGGCALAMMAPWLAKNAMWLGNPVSPFFNAWFPNPYVHVSFERQYAAYMRNFSDVKDWRAIPLEVTVRGTALAGVVGPVFLLAPVALLALRRPAGRRLLAAAALFGAVYPANIGTRFLIPVLPFLALALALAFQNVRGALPLLVLFHALASWPDLLSRYCDETAWRIAEIPFRAALRLEPESRFLARKVGGHPIAQVIESYVPPGETVLAFSAVAEAYTSRDVPVAYQSAWGETLSDIFYTALLHDYQPTQSLRFRFAPLATRGIRVSQTASGADLWSVTELRVWQGGRELAREDRWRLRASPNPWDVRMAFDNSPVTRWRSWEAIRPGMRIEIDFAAARTIDAVQVDGSRDQYQARLRLEALDAAGRWRVVSDAPEMAELPLKAGLRPAAMAEIKARGVGYIVLFNSDFAYAAVAADTGGWGLRQVGEAAGARLYRIEEGPE